MYVQISVYKIMLQERRNELLSTETRKNFLFFVKGLGQRHKASSLLHFCNLKEIHMCTCIPSRTVENQMKQCLSNVRFYYFLLSKAQIFAVLHHFYKLLLFSLWSRSFLLCNGLTLPQLAKLFQNGLDPFNFST